MCGEVDVQFAFLSALPYLREHAERWMWTFKRKQHAAPLCNIPEFYKLLKGNMPPMLVGGRSRTTYTISGNSVVGNSSSAITV